MLHFLQDLSPHVTGVALGGGRSAGAIFKIDAHAAGAAPSEDENGPRPKRYFQDRPPCCLAQHHQMVKMGRAPCAIFKIDAHAAGAAPSEDENGPRRPKRYFHESQQMLYFVQQKWGDNPYLRLNVVKSATIWAIFPDLKPTAPKLLHKIQHSPSSGVKRPENVAFFAGFVASCDRCSPGWGP